MIVFSHQVGWNYDESRTLFIPNAILYHPSTKSKDLASHGRCVKSRSEIPQASNPSTDGSFKKRNFLENILKLQLKRLEGLNILEVSKICDMCEIVATTQLGIDQLKKPSIPQPYVGSVMMDKYVRWCPSSESRDVEAHHLVNSMVCGRFW